MRSNVDFCIDLAQSLYENLMCSFTGSPLEGLTPSTKTRHFISKVANF